MQKIPLLRYLLLAVLLTMITQAHAAIKSINDFTEKMTHFSGYFSFYYDTENGKLYLEVDKLEQQFLLQQSLPYGVGSNDIGLDRGQLGDTHLVQFERFGDKVMLRAINTYYRANTNNLAEQQSIKEAFASSILAGFSVVAQSDTAVLVDYTPYLLSDVHGVSRRLSATGQGSFNLDSNRSAVYLARSKAFEKNTELEAVLTFQGNNPGKYVRQVSADPYALTVHMHHSLIELPDDNYTPRKFHPQAGFWSIEHKDYAAALGESMYVCAIHQFSRIGSLAMVGGMTGVLSDVIPYGLSLGNRNNLVGLNLIGLRRAKISNEDIKVLQKFYDVIFSNQNFRSNIENLNVEIKENKYVKIIIDFINSDKKRPISLPENIK